MSRQFRYVLGYNEMVEAYLAELPEEDAMAAAVGGNFDCYGILEYQVLRRFGLADGDLVVDIGCGSGRLAKQLARLPALRYLGFDIVPRLVDYARRRHGGPRFQFRCVDRTMIPLPDGCADMVASFSVFTHILPEESFVYLEEARRVLKPGGRVVFSFLEQRVGMAWAIFEQNVAWVRQRTMTGHLNVFLHPDDLALWADKLGFTVTALIRGDEPAVEVDADVAGPHLRAGRHRFGQSLCVLAKPA